MTQLHELAAFYFPFAAHFSSPEMAVSSRQHAQLADAIMDILFLLLPIWLSVLVGLIVGWTWRPRWAGLLVVALRSRPRLAFGLPPGFGARRIWLAATAAAAAPAVKDVCRSIWEWAQTNVFPHRIVWSRRGKSQEATSGAMTVGQVGSGMGTPVAVPAGGVRSVAVTSLTLQTSTVSACTLLPGVSAAGAVALVASADQVQENQQVPRQQASEMLTGALEPTAQPEVAGFLPATVPVVSGTLPPLASVAAHAAGRPVMTAHVDDDDEDDMEGSEEGEGVDDEEYAVLGPRDLEDFLELLDETDGGAQWSSMMEKSTNGMQYTAWRRDPQGSGPTEYRSRTIIERCPAELMRDFFWDDEFRLSNRWDDMLTFSQVVEEWPESGEQVVHWVRKFPFFCKDREYVIGRRIWSLNENTYFCITKGMTHPAVPPKESPRRVFNFYSSWRIRAVENGSCEILLFHHEDMGLQRDIAKMGIRQGMWGAVRKIEPGLRAYQRARQDNPQNLSRSASMANVHTPISPTPCPPLTRVSQNLSRSASMANVHTPISPTPCPPLTRVSQSFSDFGPPETAGSESGSRSSGPASEATGESSTGETESSHSSEGERERGERFGGGNHRGVLARSVTVVEVGEGVNGVMQRGSGVERTEQRMRLSTVSRCSSSPAMAAPSPRVSFGPGTTASDTVDEATDGEQSLAYESQVEGNEQGAFQRAVPCSLPSRRVSLTGRGAQQANSSTRRRSSGAIISSTATTGTSANGGARRRNSTSAQLPSLSNIPDSIPDSTARQNANGARGSLYDRSSRLTNYSATGGEGAVVAKNGIVPTAISRAGWLMLGGAAVASACGFNPGLMVKIAVVGVAQKLVARNRRRSVDRRRRT
eukprot:TRINITY_DN16975_c0_g1_i1.p1 TRINITY_DN16975_c0_g1~~TRINITY_DN16975_c0_g1_i1.p1  ORF type:complete len:872 (+),score=132.90 TRINITY_DN16975_c0_g1_i1:1242-3857(+)